MPRGGGKGAEDDATDAGGATEASSLAMIDLLQEQQRVTACTTSPAHSDAHSATAVSTNSHGHCETVAQDEPWEQVHFGHLQLRNPVS